MARNAEIQLGQKGNAIVKTEAELPIQSMWRQVLRRFSKNRLAVIGAFVIGLMSLTALLTPLIAPYPFDAIDLLNVKSPPSATHWLGTDELGRDALTRIMYGSRVSLSVGLLATGFSTVIGILLGSLAGYFGGAVDNVIMRLVDVMLSFPSMFLLIILGTFFTMNVLGIVVVIGGLGWMGTARLVRGEFLSLRQQEFTEAARALGLPRRRIIFRHLLPNAMASVIVAATLGVGGAILTESALSYLGVGIQPPTPSWGNMLMNAQAYVTDAPWLAIFPGLFILVTVLAFNFVGDGLRDALDPRSKNRL